MKRKMKRFLGILLSLAMVLGVMPGMPAYAAEASVTLNASTQTSGVISTTMSAYQGNMLVNGDRYINASSNKVITKIVINKGSLWQFNASTLSVSPGTMSFNGDVLTVNDINSASVTLKKLTGTNVSISSIVVYYDDPIAVTGVTLNPSTTQTISVGGSVAFTATIAPDNAADKKVKWSVTGSAVTLFSDSNCTSPIATGSAISTSTVYAKGTAAGSATVTVTTNDGSKTASYDVTVNKADPTAPTGLTATIGQTLADVTLPNGWTWADSTQNVGNEVSALTFKANFAGDDNYNAVSNVDVTVTVNKPANPATVAGTATVIKGGNTVDLAGNVTKNGAAGDVSYEISGEPGGCSLNGSVLTSGDTTGTVSVNVTVAEDDNYAALTATPITVTINDKGTQTITAENVTASYGDTDKKVNASVTEPTTGGGAISYAVKDGSADYIDVNASTGALTIKKVPADGKAYVIVTAAETSTYTQATKEVTVTINKANAVAATVTANNRTYDGTEKPLVTVTGTPTGGTMQYALGTETAATQPYTTSIPSKTDVGT